jgi:glycosyltransferase involved in cell wall biosynthesis
MSARDVVFYAPTATPLLTRRGDGNSGGAENQVVMLARELARRGHAVGVVAFGPADRRSEWERLRAELDGVDVIEHPLPATRLPILRTLAFYRAAFGTLRRHRARVVVQRTAGIHTAVAAVSARLLGAQFVYSSAGVHDFDLGMWESRRWLRWAFALGVRLAHTIVVQTDEQAALCERRFGRRPVVIRSIAEPVESATTATATAESDPPEAFLWIGTLIAYKQPVAFVELARAVPEAAWWMVGVPASADDESRQIIAAVTEAERQLPHLTLLAPRPRAELVPLLQRAVAVVNTSRTEGMPNVFLEAWSRGVPALALAHDPDGVIEREALGGFAHGSPARLAELARAMWRQREDRTEEANRCRSYVIRVHDRDLIARDWEGVLGLSPGAAGG